MALNPGDPAPAFSLPVTGGGTVELAALKGRKVVLFFYPKDDTSGCTREAQDFQALKDAFASADTTVIGVSPDPMKKHDKFRAKYGLELPLASDETKVMLQAYGVWVEKSMYGKKYMGTERSTFVIDAAGNLSAVFRKVKPEEHVDLLLNALPA